MRHFSTTLALVRCQKDNTSAPSIPSTASVRVFSAIEDIPVADWYTVVPPEEPLLRYDYLAGLASSHRGEIEMRYVLCYEHDAPVLFALFQLLPIEGRLAQAGRFGATSLGWTKHFFANKRLLVCGNAFLSGRYGFAYRSLSVSEAFAHIHYAAQAIQRNTPSIAGIFIKDFLEEGDIDTAQSTDTATGAAVGALDARPAPARFFRMPAEPAMRLPLLPTWHTYADYLAAMNTKYRQRATATQKKSADLVCRELSAQEIADYQSELYVLFRNVVREGVFSLAEPSATYFATLKKQMGNKYRVFGYFLNGKLVSFRSSLYTADAIEAHCIGYELALNHEIKLYQRLLYDTVAEGIEARISAIYFGRTATEIKSTLGAAPAHFMSYLQWKSPVMNAIAKRVVPRLQLPEFVLRHPFK